jgi:hypothetical protein
MDAEGHVTQQTAGNCLVTSNGFDATTGRLLSVSTGSQGAVQNLGYTYDKLAIRCRGPTPSEKRTSKLPHFGMASCLIRRTADMPMIPPIRPGGKPATETPVILRNPQAYPHALRFFCGTCNLQLVKKEVGRRR